MNEGYLVITPRPKKSAISITSVDVRFGRYIYVLDETKELVFDSREQTIEEFWEENGIEIDLLKNRLPNGKLGYRLKPGQVCLAMTLEHIHLPLDKKRILQGTIWSRSRTGRAFIRMHVDAPEVKPGTNNPVTLEVKNDGPITYTLYYGDPLASIGFEEVKGKPSKFKSWVHGQTRASGSKGKVTRAKQRLIRAVRSRLRGADEEAKTSDSKTSSKTRSKTRSGSRKAA
jgi:deoxycytidine triphosphate deaminase